MRPHGLQRDVRPTRVPVLWTVLVRNNRPSLGPSLVASRRACRRVAPGSPSSPIPESPQFTGDALFQPGSDVDETHEVARLAPACLPLTTLGYGNIHPNDPVAGSLCDAEAMVGQLYLAIMIARLIGLQTSQQAS